LKQWFPFTDYDFYGYIACGLVLLFAADYWHNGGHYLMHHNQWTFFQGVLVVTLAYITGQIIAMPSSTILENGLARSILRPPTVILMSNKQTWYERWIARLLGGRYYEPLPQGTRDNILDNAEKQTGKSRAHLSDHLEEVFMPAYVSSRTIEDSRKRMDDFRNQYGFNRNMAFSSLISACLLFHSAWRDSDPDAKTFAILALLLSLGMFLRFLKFYSCFSAEALRTYAFQKVVYNENRNF
jgi:hypothetical protein